MPEYKQEKIMPFKEVIVRFQTEADMISFFDVIDQKPPNKLKSIWFPKRERSKEKPQVYTDES